jgi:D-beta-D-heptose 7-phosphate kinase/D-beta-D-heptose 1-phosphate adenosyltransferase
MSFGNLSKIRDSNILVVGDVMLDHYVYGVCNRISPEAPVPILEFNSESKMLGGAGNVVRNLKKFGAQCDLLTVIGDDESGTEVIELLKFLEINMSYVIKDKSRKTTCKLRYVSASQQLIRIDIETKSAIDIRLQDVILEKVAIAIKKYDVVLISDYLKGVITFEMCQDIISLCRKNNILVIVDPKGTDFTKYFNANIIKPNLKEFEQVCFTKFENEDSIKGAAKVLKEKLKLDSLIVTLGAGGIFYSDDIEKFCPTFFSNVVDVSGAGDTVLASLAVCLACNLTIEQACTFANIAASLVISKFGTEAAGIEEVIEILKQHGHTW